MRCDEAISFAILVMQCKGWMTGKFYLNCELRNQIHKNLCGRAGDKQRIMYFRWSLR